jgi:putative ABC transport system ATP-binding protein
VIELRGIEKTYPLGNHLVHALRGVDLTIETGELVAITGPSGSGKSTLLQITGCLDSPTRGSYRLLGSEVAGLSPRKLALIRNRVLGFVFQSYHLLPRLSASRNVELPLLYAGVSRTERRDRARAALEEVGLEHRIDHKPAELSGGERQRVAVARALVTHPRILLADEPTGNLDTRSGKAVLELFRRANKDRAITVVIVTHDRAVAAAMDREIAIRDGNVLYDGAPPTVFGDRQVMPLDEQGRLGKEHHYLRTHRIDATTAVVPLPGARLTFVVEESTGARLRPMDRDDEVSIEGVPVTEEGVPLYHGMVFSVAHRHYVYFEREPGEIDQRRPYLQPGGSGTGSRRGRSMSARSQSISDLGAVDEFFVFDDSLDEGRAFASDSDAGPIPGSRRVRKSPPPPSSASGETSDESTERPPA